MEPLERARRAHELIGLAQAERDRCMRVAHDAGLSVRQIADALGLSSTRVGQIVQPQTRQRPRKGPP